MPAVKPAVKKAVAKKVAVVEQMPNGNVDVAVDAETGIITIKVNPKWNLGLSGTGKNVMIATTGAPRLIMLADGRRAKLGLNLFTPPPDNEVF